MSAKMQSNLQTSFVFAGYLSRFHNQSLMLGATASTVVRGQITTKFSRMGSPMIYTNIQNALAVSISRLIKTHLLFHLYFSFNFQIGVEQVIIDHVPNNFAPPDDPVFELVPRQTPGVRSVRNYSVSKYGQPCC